MKRFIVALLLVSGMAHAQDDCLKSVGGGACIVNENGKYGIKKKDKYIIPTYFDQLQDHSGKYFSVEQNNRWGVFSIKGQMLLPVSFNKITAINASMGLLNAEGNGYNNLIITESVQLPKFTQKVSPFAMLAEGETSVGEYLTFLQDMYSNPPKDFTYELAFPDTSRMAANVKKVIVAYLPVFTNGCQEKYFALQKGMNTPLYIPCDLGKNKELLDYLNLPITGVSFKQAQRFCVWMSDKLNAYYTQDLEYEMIARLPNPNEWEEFALEGLNDNMRSKNCIDSLNDKQCILLNYKFNQKACTHVEEQIKKYNDNVVPVYSYNPDFRGIYNMFGNVAEMTNEEGIAKGGSYVHYALQCQAVKINEYHNPEPWLGFRYCVVYRWRK